MAPERTILTRLRDAHQLALQMRAGRIGRRLFCRGLHFSLRFPT